jgi:hypothetical protein
VTRTVWAFEPDLAGRRRLLVRARLVLLAVTVIGVGLALGRSGVLAGLITLAVALLIAMVVESWGRSTPDAGPQEVWLEADTLLVEGPDLYVRVTDDPTADMGFERAEYPAGGVIEVGELSQVAWASVYPSTTRLDDVRPAPPLEFHLVLDVQMRDGDRRCVVFDRRIPFRIGGEVALAEAAATLFGHRYRQPPIDDPFGEIDERRLADWRA